MTSANSNNPRKYRYRCLFISFLGKSRESAGIQRLVHVESLGATMRCISVVCSGGAARVPSIERLLDVRFCLESNARYLFSARSSSVLSFSSVSHRSFAHSTMSLRSGPSDYRQFRISFPHERVLQVTLTRPEKLNSIGKATSREIQEVWERFDQDETLWVGIITGSGRAFCTGADLQGMLEEFYWLTSHLT